MSGEEKEKKEDRESVLTMTNYTLANGTTDGACTMPGPKQCV